MSGRRPSRRAFSAHLKGDGKDCLRSFPRKRESSFFLSPVAVGLAITFALALLMLKVPQTEIAFGWINRAVEAIAAATRAGTSFVFGYVGGGALPFDPKTPGSDFILAFQALPVVLVMSVLSSLLFYWRILPPIVRGFSCEHAEYDRDSILLAPRTNLFRADSD